MISELDFQMFMDDYEACKRGEFSLHTLAFTVATKMVSSKDTKIWPYLPDELRAEVSRIARAYQRNGEVITQSSTGRASHNELGAQLLSLLGMLLDEPTAKPFD